MGNILEFIIVLIFVLAGIILYWLELKEKFKLYQGILNLLSSKKIRDPDSKPKGILYNQTFWWRVANVLIPLIVLVITGWLTLSFAVAAAAGLIIGSYLASWAPGVVGYFVDKKKKSFKQIFTEAKEKGKEIGEDLIEQDEEEVKKPPEDVIDISTDEVEVTDVADPEILDISEPPTMKEKVELPQEPEEEIDKLSAVRKRLKDRE